MDQYEKNEKKTWSTSYGPKPPPALSWRLSHSMSLLIHSEGLHTWPAHSPRHQPPSNMQNTIKRNRTAEQCEAFSYIFLSTCFQCFYILSEMFGNERAWKSGEKSKFTGYLTVDMLSSRQRQTNIIKFFGFLLYGFYMFLHVSTQITQDLTAPQWPAGPIGMDATLELGARDWMAYYGLLMTLACRENAHITFTIIIHHHKHLHHHDHQRYITYHNVTNIQQHPQRVDGGACSCFRLKSSGRSWRPVAGKEVAERGRSSFKGSETISVPDAQRHTNT